MPKHYGVALASVRAVVAFLAARLLLAESLKPRLFHSNDQEECRLDYEVEKRTDETDFKQVSKSLFKEMYFQLRGGRASGWTADYWWDVIEPYTGLGWRFMVEEPRSAEHTRMFLVTDPKAMEHRMFFMTEQDEDHFMEWPDDE